MFWLLFWLVAKVLWFFQMFVVAHAVTTWMGLDPKNALVRLIRAPAEPILRLVRPLAKKIPGPLDWSPAIALLGLELFKRLLS